MTDESAAAPRPRSRLAWTAQLVLIPLIIVAVGLSVFILFGLVAHEQRSGADYLREIRSGTSTRRWQAAFELARDLRRSGPGDVRAMVPQVIETFEWARNEDPKIRRYLAQALGTLGDPRALDALESALDDPDADTRLWSARALALLGEPAATDALVRHLSDADPAVRKETAHALAVLGASSARDDIAGLLDDGTVDVRWNAALALAWLDDDRGLAVLLSMLDRTGLAAVSGLRPDQADQVVLGAVEALDRLGSPGGAVDALREVSRKDTSLQAREAALHALSRQGSGPRPR
ncbi:MAG: HEAT repeat domain-containing protein [Acidobacteriota bacterium]